MLIRHLCKQVVYVVGKIGALGSSGDKDVGTIFMQIVVKALWFMRLPRERA